MIFSLQQRLMCIDVQTHDPSLTRVAEVAGVVQSITPAWRGTVCAFVSSCAFSILYAKFKICFSFLISFPFLIKMATFSANCPHWWLSCSTTVPVQSVYPWWSSLCSLGIVSAILGVVVLMKMRKLVVWPFLISMITNGCLCQSGLPRVISGSSLGHWWSKLSHSMCTWQRTVRGSWTWRMRAGKVA